MCGIQVLFYIYSQLPLLTGVLENSLDLTVKMAVGQSVALLFELARDIDEDVS